jgi:hypothetical protein
MISGSPAVNACEDMKSDRKAKTAINRERIALLSSRFSVGDIAAIFT